MDEKLLLEYVLAADILILAKALKAEKAAKGTHSTSDFIPDAVRLLEQKRPEILRRLQEI